MSSVPVSVAEVYRYVVGVDTHAATQSYAVVAASTGALVDEATFPTSAAGIGRACGWIDRRSGGDRSAVLVAAEGTGSYGAVLSHVLAARGYRVVEAPAAKRDRGSRKTDALDAVRAARSIPGTSLEHLVDRRAGELHAALAVLVTSRDALNAERVRSINALTALVRNHDLSLDARRALSATQIATIAAWRQRDEALAQSIARAEAIRLAKRVGELDRELMTNRDKISALVEAHDPELLELPGVGAVTAAVILVVWSHPGRVRSEAAFAALAGTCPIPASSGNTERYRLNRGGDRRLNRALNTIVLTRMRADEQTRVYVKRRTSEGKTSREIRRCLKRYATRQVFRTLATAHRSTDAIPMLLDTT